MNFGQSEIQEERIVTPAQSTPDVRQAFLQKVYGMLSLSLLTAVAGAFISQYALQSGAIGGGALMGFMVLEIIMLITAFLVRYVAGWNLVALFGFTFVSGLTLGPVGMVYQTNTIQMALVLTTLVFGGLSFYVVTSKRDFSFLSSFLFVGLLVILLGSLLNGFFFHSPMAHFAISAGGVLLFSGFILYDTSNIIHNYDVDDTVGATLALYLDIINLFLFLLQLLNGNDRD